VSSPNSEEPGSGSFTARTSPEQPLRIELNWRGWVFRPVYPISLLLPHHPAEDTSVPPWSSSQIQDDSRQPNETGSTALVPLAGRQPALRDSTTVSDSSSCGAIQEDLWAEDVPTVNNPRPHELVTFYPEPYPLLNRDRRNAPVLALVRHLVRIVVWRVKNRRWDL